MGAWLRWLAGGLVLLAQVGGIAYSRFVLERYFCWAPYDIHTQYVLEARIGERVLSEAEIFSRYRIQKAGVDHRSPHNVIDLVRRVESRRREPGALIVLRYRVNGAKEQIWRWPG